MPNRAVRNEGSDWFTRPLSVSLDADPDRCREMPRCSATIQHDFEFSRCTRSCIGWVETTQIQSVCVSTVFTSNPLTDLPVMTFTAEYGGCLTVGLWLCLGSPASITESSFSASPHRESKFDRSTRNRGRHQAG
jgi:hypothetical protein